MQIKVVPPANFLVFRTLTKIDQLANFLPIGQQLIREAVKNTLFIAGPIHWHYYDFTGDLSKAFTLEVLLPVTNIIKEYDGEFHFKRTDSFRCVTSIHEGKWTDIPATYAKVVNFVQANRLKPTAINREVYVNVDFINPDANIVGIQMGVAE